MTPEQHQWYWQGFNDAKQEQRSDSEQLSTECVSVSVGEPVAWALEWSFNGDEVGRRLYDDETHCKFDADSDGGVCRPLVYGDTSPQPQKPLSDEMAQHMKERCDSMEMRGAFVDGWLSAEAAHSIKGEA